MKVLILFFCLISFSSFGQVYDLNWEQNNRLQTLFSVSLPDSIYKGYIENSEMIAVHKGDTILYVVEDIAVLLYRVKEARIQSLREYDSLSWFSQKTIWKNENE